MKELFRPYGYTLMQGAARVPKRVHVSLSTGKREHGRRTSEIIASVMPRIRSLEQAARVHDIMSKEEIRQRYGEYAADYAALIQGSRRDVLRRCRDAEPPGRILILADFHDQLMILSAFFEAEGEKIWKKYQMNEKELYRFSRTMQQELLDMVSFSEETAVLYIDSLCMINDLFAVSYADADGQILCREYPDGECFTAGREAPLWLPAENGIANAVRISGNAADALISRWQNEAL